MNTPPFSKAARRKRRAECLAIALMLLGVLMVCQPFLHALFRWGFLVTLLGIAAFLIASHLPEREKHDG